jgi:pimeloyl-ACP methyl ester carboxylesterase
MGKIQIPSSTVGIDRRRFSAQLLVASLPGALVSRPSHAAPAVPEGSWTSKFADVRGLRMHFVEQGSGPLVLLCHGFPELWFSWRHQIPALADSGYRVVAPDLRGYGATGGSESLTDYSIKELVADLTALLDALGEKTCVIVGHDFGAVLTWNAVLLAPDRFKAMAALSVPYNQRRDTRPIAGIQRAVGGNFNYILYFQEPGVAERELEPDMERFLRTFYHHASAEGTAQRMRLASWTSRAKLMETLVAPPAKLRWLPEDALRYYVESFRSSGLTGPLNWYRNLDNNWEQMSAFKGANIGHPALFIVGTDDPVLRSTQANYQAMTSTVPGLRRSVVLPGCGHWIQQECPVDVNRELLAFLAQVAR